MRYLFEKQDSLNMPIEAFSFDAVNEEFPVKPHWHYFAEFIYMRSGSAKITSDDNEQVVREGEFAILFPSAVHSIVSAQEELPVYDVIKFDLNKFKSTNAYSPSPAEIFRFARTKGMKYIFDKKSAKALKCTEIFEECIVEYHSYNYGMNLVMRSDIYRLVYGIIRQWIDAGLNIGECPMTGENYDIENITEYIDGRLDEKLKISDIARECHQSYSGFAAKFRARYGMSCKEYIERMRIFKAEEYLLFTDHDLDFISEHAGFSDSSHLIHEFKKYRGITPKQYRMEKQNQQ